MKSWMRFLRGAVVSVALSAAGRHDATVLAFIERSLQAHVRRRLSDLRKRLERAENASRQPRNTISELATFAFMSLILLVIGVGFMLAVAASPTLDGRIFVFAVSLSALLLFTLFLSKFGDYAGALSDIDRIGDFERVLRQQLWSADKYHPPGQSRPANDH